MDLHAAAPGPGDEKNPVTALQNKIADLMERMAQQDDVLISITGGRVNNEVLRQLPPWRAVLFARVAYSAGAMTREELDRLVKEARDKGGKGTLRTWEQEQALVKRSRGWD